VSEGGERDREMPRTSSSRAALDSMMSMRDLAAEKYKGGPVQVDMPSTRGLHSSTLRLHPSNVCGKRWAVGRVSTNSDQVELTSGSVEVRG